MFHLHAAITAHPTNIPAPFLGKFTQQSTRSEQMAMTLHSATTQDPLVAPCSASRYPVYCHYIALACPNTSLTGLLQPLAAAAGCPGLLLVRLRVHPEAGGRVAQVVVLRPGPHLARQEGQGASGTQGAPRGVPTLAPRPLVEA